MGSGGPEEKVLLQLLEVRTFQELYRRKYTFQPSLGTHIDREHCKRGSILVGLLHSYSLQNRERSKRWPGKTKKREEEVVDVSRRSQ